MIVDVSWDGVSLVQGAQAREEAGGWFVELEQPMPVGTRLRLTGETEANVRVARVHEGLGAGMLVRPEGAVTSAPKPAEPAAATKPAQDAAAATKPAQDAAAATAPSPEGATAEGDSKESSDDGGSGGNRRDRRRKRKPTV